MHQSMPPETTPFSRETGWTTGVQLASVDPGRNRFRRYTLSWQPALWGGGALVRSWGRRGTTGRSQATFYAQEEEAQHELQRLLRVRVRHGYQLLASGPRNENIHRARQPGRPQPAHEPAAAWWWLPSPLRPNSQLPLL
jgi:predicted DNA-binding WGR domain protein